MRFAAEAARGSGLLGHGLAIPTQTFTHSFVALQTCGLLIRATKPSHTAGTLGDIMIGY